MVPPGSCALLARLSCARQVTRNGKNTINLLSTHLRCLSVTRHPLQNVTTDNAQDKSEVRTTEKISKAMKAYLERARKHDEFMAKENVEFNIGKRHLANMMGLNPETLTQDDIDSCISYLFPSGLYEPRARPLMRPPKEVFPQRKAAEFDASGRPFHSMFYTSKPNYYQLLYDIVTAIKECDKREDAARRQNIVPEPLDLSSSMWVSIHELEKILYEELVEKQHAEFVQTMERLLQHPFAFVAKDFMLNYRKPLSQQTDKKNVPKPQYDADGRPYVTVTGCIKKQARGVVTVRGNGTGQITINGQDILYFTNLQDREQVIFPLIFTGLSRTIDVEATVHSGGPSGQASAIRWGIAWGLRSFVDSEMLEKMRIAGLLTRDWRRKERKKPGQEGARRKFTWKKR